jgi:hypothetical protein
MWARIAELATASADELRDQAVARNFAQAEQAVRVALEQSTEQQRAALAQQLEDGAREATQGEEPASPWQELAQFMRAAALVLRRLPVDGRTLSDANRHRIERLLTLARPAPAFESGAEELPASVLYALMHNDAAALEAALQALPTQERVQVVTALEQQMHEQMVQLSSDERQAVIAEAQQAQIADAADRARDVAIGSASHCGRSPRLAVAPTGCLPGRRGRAAARAARAAHTPCLSGALRSHSSSACVGVTQSAR